MKLNNTVSWWIQVWLRIFGIWPESSCILLRRLFWIAALLTEQIFQYQYVVTNFYSRDLPVLMNALSEIMAYLLLLIKLGIFWCKQRTFDQILEMMAIDREKCSSAELDVFPATRNAKLSQRLANLTVAVYTIAVVFYSSEIFMPYTDDEISNGSTRPLILRMELPFNADEKFVYQLVIIGQFFHLLTCTCVIGILNALLVNLVLHVSGQIDILSQWLTDIFTQRRERDLSLIMIRKVIRKHQKIIVFSQHIDNLFSNIALTLFVTDTLIICCLGFVLVASIGSPDALQIIARTFSFYFVINLEAFVFCLAGEYLSNKSRTIGDAAYNSLWYESDAEYSRIVLFLIMRSQNQLTVMIGKITNLSLERFSSIIKASASYVSVLLAMY